jgi:hypothetical protein
MAPEACSLLRGTHLMIVEFPGKGKTETERINSLKFHKWFKIS